MSKLRRKKPKVKMRSYGSGEKLPVVKSGKDFYLADEKFDSKGHGKFVGQTTGKLEGPSKRAIKGKGKKSANVLSVTGDVANVMDVESYETFDLPIPAELKDQVTEGCEILYWTILTDKVMKQVKGAD